jgi:hypothetical protein
MRPRPTLPGFNAGPPPRLSPTSGDLGADASGRWMPGSSRAGRATGASSPPPRGLWTFTLGATTAPLPAVAGPGPDHLTLVPTPSPPPWNNNGALGPAGRHHHHHRRQMTARGSSRAARPTIRAAGTEDADGTDLGISCRDAVQKHGRHGSRSAHIGPDRPPTRRRSC